MVIHCAHFFNSSILQGTFVSRNWLHNLWGVEVPSPSASHRWRGCDLASSVYKATNAAMVLRDVS